VSLRVRRLAIVAPLAELIPVALLAGLLPSVLAFGNGTVVYQITETQRLALWVGPMSGFVACALGGWWVSASGRIAGGYAGGWWAGRRNRPAAPATSSS
jgi:hypothetical protein